MFMVVVSSCKSLYLVIVATTLLFLFSVFLRGGPLHLDGGAGQPV